MKRMKHPQHGFHHVYDGNEEARMRANGWVDDEPAAPEALQQAESDPVPVSTSEATKVAPESAVKAPADKAAPKRRGPNKARGK